MDDLQPDDVPYGNDWDSSEEVASWAAGADQKRPWRAQIRDEIAKHISTLPSGARILELGSGPGFLAHQVLQHCPNVERYVCLDFSEPMLTLSVERLALFPAATFVLTSFKSANWTHTVAGPFDCVVSMQAIHELRHKRHAIRLYGQVYRLLTVPGCIMICDHTPLDDSSRSSALYMTTLEQQAMLAEAGFANVHIRCTLDTLVLYEGERCS